MTTLSPPLSRWSTRLLALIGCLALLYAAGALCLHWMRNSAPDSRADFISPDRIHRMVVTEMLVGFPGQTCVKDVYILRAGDKLVRSDDEGHVYAGACDGLVDIRWVGNNVEGEIDLAAALKDVAALSLRRTANAGTVLVSWNTPAQLTVARLPAPSPARIAH